MKNKIIVIRDVIVITVSMMGFFSCAHKSGHNRVREHTSFNAPEHVESKVRSHAKVHMIKEGGVYMVPITVNGLDLRFIFDTGASSISLSSAEAMVMLRQGLITEDDIMGQQQFQDATGGVSVGTVIRLRTVEIGGITLNNVEATVVDNIQAPLLLGQTALSKFGKVTIDYDNNIIEFN
jgi:aspartyl protease family protein